MMVKACTQCGAVKSLTQFYRNPHHMGGVQSACRQCQNLTVAARKKVWQQQTVPTADRNNQPWSAAELRVLADRDLTSKAVALRLGRTYSSVRSARIRMNKGIYR